MKLNGKCEIEFDTWLVKPEEDKPSTANIMDRRNFANMFYGLPDEAQIGSYTLYFDSVRIDVSNYKFFEYFRVPLLIEDLVKSRKQAWTQVIKKANKTRNEQLNK